MLKKVPHTYVIVFFIIVMAAVFTWILPGGEYVKTIQVLPDGTEQTIMEYHKTGNQPKPGRFFQPCSKDLNDRPALLFLF